MKDEIRKLLTNTQLPLQTLRKQPIKLTSEKLSRDTDRHGKNYFFDPIADELQYR